MRAVSYRGPTRLRVIDKPEPRVEDPGDAIVHVTRTAICGSDLHLYHGYVPDTRVGATFGHEFTGVVTEVGFAVEGLAPGDRVVVPFNIACGHCFFCARELYSACENSNPHSDLMGGVFGYSHTTGGYEGGQAEYVRVPFADVGPMKIPDDMADEDVLFLSDILPTGYQAAEMGDIERGDTVVVFGCGPVGLFAQLSARLLGARRSIAHRLLGATMLQAGAATALGWAIDTARRGGRVSIVGVYGPPWNLVPIGTAMNKGLTLRMGQCNVKRYMPRLLEHIRDGRIAATQIITHRLPLEAAPDAYALFARKQDECIKCVLLPEAA
jgi:threonine dehydrogenase-like Zn-dependent dehydrogenase